MCDGIRSSLNHRVRQGYQDPSDTDKTEKRRRIAHGDLACEARQFRHLVPAEDDPLASSMKSKRTRPKRLFFATTALLIGLGVPLLILKASVRLFDLGPPLVRQYGAIDPDPYLPHKPRPSNTRRGRASTGEFAYEYVHNSFGRWRY